MRCGMDGRTDEQTDGVKPIYPQQLSWGNMFVLSAAIVGQKVVFQYRSWQSSWKLAAIL